jgi:TATA-binding protein-associated factor
VHDISQPPDKIVKNLCTFLCQDVEKTPTFTYHRKNLEGIITIQDINPKTTGKGANGKDKDKDKEKPEAPKPEDQAKAQLSRRGAGLAFEQLSAKFGGRVLDVIPAMWNSMAGGLQSAFQSGSIEDCDTLLDRKFGQDVIDSLSVMEAVVPSLHQDIWPKIVDTFPMMLLALRSKFAIVRQSAARCLSTVCSVMTSEGMRFVIEQVVPLLGDPLSLTNRQGASELIHRKCESASLGHGVLQIRRYHP